MRCLLLSCLALAVAANVATVANAQTSRSQNALSDVQSRMAAGMPTRIVCFGDSITGVYYHSGGRRAWCDMLGIALSKAYPAAKLEMINAGISGHTTVQALARIKTDVLDRNPHLVVIKFGMNDVARGPVETFKANLATIVNRCRAAGAAVVLCTPNSVIENSARPNAKLARFSQAVRDLASARQVLLVDLFDLWQQQRKQDEMAWALLMSDAIHPNMNGHRRIAEAIASRISGKAIIELSLANVPPPQDALNHTFLKLSQQQTVHIVAMVPYDRLIPQALRRQFPQAEFKVTTWVAQKQSVDALATWAKRIRGLKPDLVLVAVPAQFRSAGLHQYIRNYEWVLNHSFAFTGRPWDVLPILPSAKNGMSTENFEYQQIATKIVRGKDVIFFPSDDQSLADWIAQQRQSWDQRHGR